MTGAADAAGATARGPALSPGNGVSHPDPSPAVASMHPSFEELVQAYYRVPVAEPSIEYEELERLYETRHGGITHRCFSSKEQAAVVITAEDGLQCLPPVKRGRAVLELFLLAQDMQAEARHAIRPVEYDACVSLLFNALATAIRLLDASDGEPSAETMTLLRRQLEQAKRTYVEAATRQATLWYALGVVLGTGLIFCIALATYVVIPHLVGGLVSDTEKDRIGPLFAACLNAGGAGALLSVMMRLASHTLVVRLDAGRWLLILLGLVRPIIGGVSGVAAFTLYQAQLVPLTIPKGAGGDLFVFGGLAFLAGFSERLAQDSFVRTGRRALGGEGKSAGRPNASG